MGVQINDFLHSIHGFQEPFLLDVILVVVWIYVSSSQLVVSSYPSLPETEIRRLGKGNHTQEEEVDNIINTGITSDRIHQRKEREHNVEEAGTSTKQLQKSETITENDTLAPRSGHKRERSQTLQSYAWKICNWDTGAGFTVASSVHTIAAVDSSNTFKSNMNEYLPASQKRGMKQLASPAKLLQAS